MKILIIPLLVLLTGCDFIDPTRAAKEDEARLRHLKFQQMCSDAGTQFWKENKSGYEAFFKDEKTSLDYSNHYNQRLNKCLVQVVWHSNIGDSSKYNASVLDAFDKNVIADETVSPSTATEMKKTSLNRDGKSIESTESNLKWFDSLMDE